MKRQNRYSRRAGHAAALATFVALMPVPTLGHPHVFIDAGLEIGFDDEGRAALVQVVWVFDEFYSLLSITDFDLDPSFSGTLTEAERETLAEIYSNWQPGFEGDLYPEQGGVPLNLSGPFDFRADYREGRIIVSHRRRIEPPARPGEVPLVFKVYDPTYYIAHTIAAPPQLRGAPAGCMAEIILPDFSFAAEQLQAAMDEMLGGDGFGYDSEGNFPEIGAEFAQEVHVTCAAPS